MNELISSLEASFLKLAECAHSLETAGPTTELQKSLGFCTSSRQLAVTVLVGQSLVLVGRLQEEIAAAKASARDPHLGCKHYDNTKGLKRLNEKAAIGKCENYNFHTCLCSLFVGNGCRGNKQNLILGSRRFFRC